MKKKIRFCVWMKFESLVGMSEFGHKVGKSHKDVIGEFDTYEEAQDHIEIQEIEPSESFWGYEFWIEKVWVFDNE